MAKLISLLLIAFSLAAAGGAAARILDQITPPIPFPDDPLPPPPTTPPVEDQPPATTTAAPVAPTEPAPAPPAVAPPAVTPPETGGGGGAPGFSFFMHDILGGTRPSGRVVTGIVASSDAGGLPFSKPNNQIFPVNGGVPLNTVTGFVNNNNYPFLVGLNGASAVAGARNGAFLQSNGNNVQTGDSQAFVSAGQLPQGVTLQQLMFGSVTVVDNQITAGHELGAAVLGGAQGFYIASSSDGSAHTLVLSAIFHSGGEHHEIVDTLSFFGIHRTAAPVSHIAVIGGTGKYENAKGYATIETLPHVDQHTTDGIETITHFTVYLTP
ncbi:dirigent protein 24-like [Andrographis paniculata]|uniref:dirigent protein 24-like n=1 Tax=Andrographis paniculata TaxID=175694 RepID=UPI0021E982B4|nr:dirigent protein 24-like [Andrographis paniculata]